MDGSNELVEWLRNIGARQADIAAILTDPAREPGEAFGVLTKSLCSSLRAERVGIWSLTPDQNALQSCDFYSQLDGSHSNDVRLQNDEVAQFIVKLRAQQSSIVALTEGPFSAPVSISGRKRSWEPAKTALVASSNIAPLQTGFLTAARISNKAPWLPQEIELARSAVNYLPILFTAQENKRSLSELKKSLSLLTGTLESTGEGIVATGLDRRIILANQRFMEMIGRANISASTLQGTTINDYLIPLATNPDRIYSEANRLYGDPELQGVNRIEFKNGRILERFSRPQRIEGKIVGRIFSYRDITARVLADRTRERLEVELRQSQKLEAIGTLAGGIAHDFNNILSGIACNIELRVRIGRDLPLILADTTAVHQVVVNLCTNARQAIGDQQGRLGLFAARVFVDPDHAPKIDLRPGHYLRLSVLDTGCGMDKAVLDHIFEPFFTTKAPGNGTGLGLAVVHGIVRAHGGSIKVASRPGRGTRFDLFFPEHQGEANPAGTEPKPLATGNGETILFVDDEPILIHVGGKILERLGYRPVAFQDPAEAEKAFALNPSRFQAAICDLSMPSMNGLELASRLHALRPELPVLIVTGNQTRLSEEQLRSAGVREVLLKPLSGAAIATSLAGIFRR